MRAGFEGVEVLGASGYIIDQLLRDGSNHRTGAYGGSVQNRMGLLNEVVDMVCAVWPAVRVRLTLRLEEGVTALDRNQLPLADFEESRRRRAGEIAVVADEHT